MSEGVRSQQRRRRCPAGRGSRCRTTRERRGCPWCRSCRSSAAAGCPGAPTLRARRRYVSAEGAVGAGGGLAGVHLGRVPQHALHPLPMDGAGAHWHILPTVNRNRHTRPALRPPQLTVAAFADNFDESRAAERRQQLACGDDRQSAHAGAHTVTIEKSLSGGGTGSRSARSPLM